ncbi:hypothetical protein ACFX2G_044932 [Malus domestica]
MSPLLRVEFCLSKMMVNLGVLFLDRLRSASSHEWVKHEGAMATVGITEMELVDTYKISLLKFTVKIAIQYMRRVIQKKVKFDILT